MKPGRIIRNILLGLVSLVLILLVALQVILRPKVLPGIVNQVAATYVDGGELTFDRVKASVIKDFPHLNFTIDGGALTYPHDRFAAFDSTMVEKGRFPLLRAGRAPERDTLASFHRLTASLNYVTLLRKTSYDIRRVELDRPRIFAHYYDSTAANWNILRLGGSEDTTSAPLPPIRVQRVLLTGRPFIVYTNRQDTLLGVLRMKELAFDGKAIGYSITKDDLEANQHMKFATGECDTGVIISWHAEGPKNVEANLPLPNLIIGKNGISINPLNWKRDETYAPASMNKGSIVMDEKTGATEIRDIDGDAQVCLARGTVVTNAKAVPNEMTDLAGPQCYHQDDYSIFYNNIKDNVAKRIAAYKANL